MTSWTSRGRDGTRTQLDESLIDLVRAAAIARYSDAGFVHHEWYVTHHIRIVERIAEQLLEFHPSADSRMVHCMVWLHDIGKTEPGADRARNAEMGARILEGLGFDHPFCRAHAENILILDARRDLGSAPVEVQVVSSADGCSHLAGPFMSIYWKENSEKTVDELIAENQRKASIAWNLKITLPEARAAFESRYRDIMQMSDGLSPDPVRSSRAAAGGPAPVPGLPVAQRGG